jgi:hypothetical protein
MNNAFAHWFTIDQGEGTEAERQRLEEAATWLAETDIRDDLLSLPERAVEFSSPNSCASL